jgi:DnaK suppressor protein
MATRKKVTKKTAAKSGKKKAAQKAARKQVTKKKVSRKKTAAKKKVTKKKVSKKKVSKKPASKKKAAGKKASKKKVAKKTATKKKSAKKNSAKKKSTKKTSRKKVTKKKVPAKKKASSKKVSKKKVTKKKVTSKKTSKKKATAKPVAKKASGKKKAVAKKTAGKAAAAKQDDTDEKPAGKRKIAISTAPVKRPVRVASLAPVNPADQIPVRPKRRKKVSDDQLIHGITPYPLVKGEEYMNDAQLEHFSNILTAWKDGLMQEVDRTVHHMQDEASNFPDPNDRATQESEFGLELRTRDRERKLLKKINQALTRVEEGSYGFCEETGDEIGLKRLEARPVATLSVEAQERREVTERQYRDHDDRYR